MRERMPLIVVAALAVFCAAAGWVYLHASIARNLRWDEHVEIEHESRLGSVIFDLAQAQRLLLPYRGPQGELLIRRPSCEELMTQATLDNSGRAAALRLLCNSPQGEELLNEVDAWNASYDLLAVRDNRFQDEKCLEKELTAAIFVPRGCKPNSWKVERILGDEAVPVDWIPKAEPPPGDFAMLVDLQAPSWFAGDWAMLRSARTERSERPQYRLSDTLTIPAGQIVTVDIVGRLRKVSIARPGEKMQDYVINRNKPETARNGVRLGPARLDVFLHCGEDEAANDDDEDTEEGDNDDDCVAEPARDEKRTVAYQIQLRIDPRVALPAKRGNNEARTIGVVLELEPTENIPPRMRRTVDDDDFDFTVRRTLHLRERCKRAAGEAAETCALTWNRIPGGPRRKVDKYRIVLGGDAKPEIDLINKETGDILAKAYEDGLAPLVGLNREDEGSLIAALARRAALATKPTDPQAVETFRLTIDPAIQAAARAAVEAGEVCQSRRMKKGRRAALPPCVRLRNEQTATLVVMDADKKAGEILAVATWPHQPRHLHVWDLLALEESGTSSGTLGWRLTTGNQRPGSTFKAITALSAIRAATAPDIAPDEAKVRIASLLQGKLNAADQAKTLHLRHVTWSKGDRGRTKCSVTPGRPEDVNSIPVPTDENPRWCAQNYHKGPYWQVRPLADSRCPAAVPGRGNTQQFSLCEAVMVSSNLFFGGLSQQLAAFAPTVGGNGLLVTQIAQRLTFGNPGAAQAPTAPFDLVRTDGVLARKLRADRIRFDLDSAAMAAKNLPKLIRTGYGDGAGATPLAIATVYAAVGSGKLVRPTLSPIPRDSTGCPLVRADDECGDLLPDRDAAAPFIAILRAGLHAVPLKGGTTSAFAGADTAALVNMPRGEPRLFIKTGTATVSTKPAFFTLWTAGWIEGVDGPGISRRLAFACMVTKGRASDTGGGTCAPIVRQFLLSLNKTMR
jgi:hypothetical protein